jgi:hypothetical protein
LRVLVDIGHPAHVHFFRNTIKELQQRGHEVMVTSRDKDVAISLLDAYGIDHVVLSSMKQGKGNLMKEWIIRDFKLLNIARKFKPDVLTGISNPSVAHIAKLLNKKSIIFNDTEHAKLAEMITHPFADVICTPSCFNKPLGKKQVTYEGYHELAYLHPNYFTPNPDVLNELGLKEEDTFIILRFVSWGASHDGGQHGIQNRLDFVRELEKHARVLITSEADMGPEFEKYKIKTTPEKLHDMIYYATLYVGDGGTTASECAVLGTTAIFISTIACGYQYDEINYGLLHLFSDPINGEKDGLEKAVDLLQEKDLKQKSLEMQKKLLSEKIDVTAFMVDFIENIKFKR